MDGVKPRQLPGKDPFFDTMVLSGEIYADLEAGNLIVDITKMCIVVDLQCQV